MEKVLRRRGLRMSLVVSALTAAVALAGCSDSGGNAGMPMMGTTTEDVSASDVMFVRMMIPHHEQAVEMSALAPERTDDQHLLDLADRISGAQTTEIALMEGWLQDWGFPQMPSMGGHDGHMAGMLDDDEMDALAASSAEAFDRLFLTLMIDHHEGAIEMAEWAQSGGENDEVAALLADIIETQTAEIAEMEGMLTA